MALDDAVVAVVNGLKAKGLTSPYLKNFVVARVNFLRFKPAGTAEFEPTLAKLTEMAQKFKIDNVKKEDVAKMGGGSPIEAED
jgi:ParB family chromosome partitioning protein